MASTRSLIHAIVQSSNVELYHSRGVAIAPLPVSAARAAKQPHFDWVGFVTFHAPAMAGHLAMSMSDDVYGLFGQAALETRAARDLLRELTNQLVGRIKNRLLQFQITLRVGLPQVMSVRELEQQWPSSHNEVVYSFRTLRGPVVVTVDATVDEGALVYSSAVKHAKEGDFIVF